ncbi:MAG TPA: FAD-binding oxidoreductase [Verrucomicrobiae bacterium]|jgi:FAD/FMN-containing dehydrogenase
MTDGLEHNPADMTATVAGEMTIAALQARLAKNGQWLPLDPPAPEWLTVAEALARDISGPRRCGYGPIRDFTIGLKAVLADGRVIHSGGKVVKNVAGYDLLKLFIGARGSLGPIVEAAFKLRPLPECEEFVKRTCASLAEAGALLEAVLESPLEPAVLDLHSPAVLVLGLAGPREDVDWQLSRARALGFSEPANLDYEKNFWNGEAQKISVLPSRLIETISGLGGVAFVARAANGIIYCRGALNMPKADVPVSLMRRVKEAFDPSGLLPALPI